MYTIIQTIEEAIYSKKQQIKYQMDEIRRIDDDVNRGRKDVAALEQELRQLKDGMEQRNQQAVHELNKGADAFVNRAACKPATDRIFF